MEIWERLPEGKNPHYGKRSIVFALGDKTYKVLTDEENPDRLFVTYQEETWTWHIECIEKSGIKFRVMGHAYENEPVLSDYHWFELHCDESPKIIFWGDGVVVRIDHSV